jgi:hypothetical protein
MGRRRSPIPADQIISKLQANPDPDAVSADPVPMPSVDDDDSMLVTRVVVNPMMAMMTPLRSGEGSEHKGKE